MSTSYGKWSIDFSSLDNSRNAKGPLIPKGFSHISGPLIRGDERNERALSAQEDREKLKVKKAWDIALAPAKSIPMNAFMLWMSGGGVQIFSIMITGMLFFQADKGHSWHLTDVRTLRANKENGT